MADYRNGDTYNRDRDRDRDRWRDDDRGRGDRNDRSDRSIFNMGGSSDRNDRGRWRDDDRDEDRWGRSEHGRGGRDEERGHGGQWDRSNERGYGADDHRRGLPVDETGHLIASNKVEGTAVYGRDGEKLGSIYNFMVDKFSGKVEYAVMAYGGFLGMGERYYPLPWRTLTYDTRERGYRIDMMKRDLETAPSFDRDSEPKFDRSYGNRVHDYYGLNY